MNQHRIQIGYQKGTTFVYKDGSEWMQLPLGNMPVMQFKKLADVLSSQVLTFNMN